MGSSTRKKKEKKKDFQKPKLKVGKTKAKPDNFTDTSFKAKSITVTQQSLTSSERSITTQCMLYLSLASTSKSEKQRRDALSYLTTQHSSDTHAQPLSAAILLPKLLPLILDGSSSVRSQLLKLFRCLPAQDVGDRAEQCLLYVRAGMTHLAQEIVMDALGVLEWLLEVADEEIVGAPGGWVKTLKSFMSMLRWSTIKETDGWTSASKISSSQSGKGFPRQLQIFSKFLDAGLRVIEIDESVRYSAVNIFWPRFGQIPITSNPFGHLNLFGSPRDEEGEMYTEWDARQRAFGKLFFENVKMGVENAKKAGGESGRAAAVLAKVLQEGMKDYSG